MTGQVTNIVAVAGIGVRWWLPDLEAVSQHAALWMPILGVVWLITQTVRAWLGKK